MKTFADAKEYCETEAMNGLTTGRLFEPMRKSQNDMVYGESITQFGGLKNIWIGVKRGRGKWKYTSTGVLSKFVFENWHPGQPDNGAHDCVHLFNEQWYNYDCNYKTFFICQFVREPKKIQNPSYDENY